MKEGKQSSRDPNRVSLCTILHPSFPSALNYTHIHNHSDSKHVEGKTNPVSSAVKGKGSV